MFFSFVCPGEAFHPNDHHQHTDLSAPPNSPTGLSSQHSSLLPLKSNSGLHGHVTSSCSGGGMAAHAPFSPLVPNLHSPTAKLSSPSPDSPTSVHKPSPCKNSHIPSVNTQHGKLGTSLMGCNHSCNGHSQGTGPPSNVGHLTAGACRFVRILSFFHGKFHFFKALWGEWWLVFLVFRDQVCKGHKVTNGTLCHPSSELDEGEDEDSSSERSSCASSSTNQKDGKYCDCCYCEFFGHNAVCFSVVFFIWCSDGKKCQTYIDGIVNVASSCTDKSKLRWDPREAPLASNPPQRGASAASRLGPDGSWHHWQQGRGWAAGLH